MISEALTVKAIRKIIVFIFTNVACSTVIGFLTGAFAIFLVTDIRVSNGVISEALTITTIRITIIFILTEFA